MAIFYILDILTRTWQSIPERFCSCPDPMKKARGVTSWPETVWLVRIYNLRKSLCSVQLYGKRSTHNHAQAFQHNHIQSSAEQAPFSEAGFILIYKTSGATPSFCVAPEACIRFRTAYTPSIYPDKSAAYFTILSRFSFSARMLASASAFSFSIRSACSVKDSVCPSALWK